MSSPGYYVCQLCGRSFTNYEQFRLHYASHNDNNKADQSEPLESDNRDMFPTFQAAEEIIARYGQIVLWLRNTARWSEDRDLKKTFKILEQEAIREFAYKLELHFHSELGQLKDKLDQGIKRQFEEAKFKQEERKKERFKANAKEQDPLVAQ